MCTHVCTCTPSCKHMNTHASTSGWTWIMLGQHSRGGSLLIYNFHLKVGKYGHLVIKLFSCYGISQDKSDLIKLLVVLVSLLIISSIVIICVYKAGWWSIKKGWKNSNKRSLSLSLSRILLLLKLFSYQWYQSQVLTMDTRGKTNANFVMRSMKP